MTDALRSPAEPTEPAVHLPGGRPVLALPGGTDPGNVERLTAAIGRALDGEPDGGLDGEPARPVLVPIDPRADPVGAAREVAARVAGAARGPDRRYVEGLVAGTDVILQTSGSTTGRGHLVGISWEALRASAHATHAALGGPGGWLVNMPVHHVAGFQVLVRSVLAAVAPQVLDTSGGFRAAQWADAARRVLARSGPAYASMVPTQLLRVTADPGALEALAGFSAVLVGGAATPAEALARARAGGARPVTTYGMSETGGGCVYDGVPIGAARVHVEQDTGRIRVSGPVLAAGYLDDPAATREAFDGRTLVTSDRGTWDGERLRVLGRVDDVLVTGGVKVDPGAVERVLLADGAAEACVVGVPDPEWGVRVVAVVVPGDTSMPAEPPQRSTRQPADRRFARASAEEVARVRELVRGKLGAAHAPRAVLLARSLPLRGPGKIDRRGLTQQVAQILGAGER